MLPERFPAPQHCPLLPLTAGQAVSTYFGGRSQPQFRLPCSCPLRGLPAQEPLLPNLAHPRCFYLELRIPPRGSQPAVLPGAHLDDCQASASAKDPGPSQGPSSAPLPSFPTRKSPWPRPNAGGGRRDPAGKSRAVSGGRRRGRPRPHALYLRRACPPPPRRLRSASVPRAPSPYAHAYLARPDLSRGLQAVCAHSRT